MKTFSKDEFRQSCGISLDQLIEPLTSSDRRLETYHIPTDSGRKTSLAKLLSNLLLADAEVVVYITGWSVWQSAEHLDLFYSYRKSRGEERILMQAPVHLFVGDPDKQEFISIVAMLLYFVWDAKIFDRKGDFLLSISHDEFMDVHGDGTTSKAIAEGFSSFGLQRLEHG